jgi:HK97 family phage major capsid protein
MPAAAAPERPNTIQTRHLSGEILRVRAGGEEPQSDGAVRYEFTASTDGVVQVWGNCFEILDHAPGSVRMEWFQSGNAPALWMHNREEIRGVIEKAVLASNKITVTVRMSPNEAAQDLIRDIDAGIIRNVSIGYRVYEEDIESRELDEDGWTTKAVWRVTDWEPKEISFVTIPADPETGFGRSDDDAKSRVRFLEEKANTHFPTRQPIMSDPAKPTISVEESNQQRADALTAERGRVAAIYEAAAAARKNGMGDFEARAQEAVEKGEPLAEFQRHVLANMKRTEPVTTEDIGLTPKEQKRYSLMNIYDGLRNDDPSLYEFEREVSIAARKLNDHEPKEAGKSVCIPSDVLLRGWLPKNPTLAARMGLTDRERTLISVSASTANVSNLVPRELMADMFIESLREDQVLLADATILAGLVGDVDIPIELLNPSFYWVGEDIEPTDGVWTASLVQFRFKTIAARISMTRRSLKQSTPNIESVLASNLRRGCALGIERQAFFGAGSSTVPTGILNTSGIGDVASGGTLTYDNTLELRSDVASANALTLGSKFYTNSLGVRRLRATGIVANDAKRIAEWGPDGQLYCEGRVVKETNLIPSTLGAGSNKTAILYGDARTLYVGMWGGMEFGVDTATKANTGGRTLRIFQDVDFQLPQPAHWSAIQDLN